MDKGKFFYVAKEGGLYHYFAVEETDGEPRVHIGGAREIKDLQRIRCRGWAESELRNRDHSEFPEHLDINNHYLSLGPEEIKLLEQRTIKDIYVARNIRGHFVFISLEIGEDREPKVGNYANEDFDKYCLVVKRMRDRGYELINWDIDEGEEYDPLRTLESLADTEMDDLEERTRSVSDAPTAKELEKMFGL